ncbi:MAG: hypothetical protein AAFR23_04745 [Pseudomonadota bacterium]
MTLEIEPSGIRFTNQSGAEVFSTSAPMFHQIGPALVGSVTAVRRVASNTGDVGDYDQTYIIGSCDPRADVVLGAFKLKQSDPWPSVGQEPDSWFQAGGTYVHEFRPMNNFRRDNGRVQVNDFYPPGSYAANQRHTGYWRSFDWVAAGGQVVLRERCFIKQKNDEAPTSGFVSERIQFDYYLIVGTVT